MENKEVQTGDTEEVCLSFKLIIYRSSGVGVRLALGADYNQFKALTQIQTYPTVALMF